MRLALRLGMVAVQQKRETLESPAFAMDEAVFELVYRPMLGLMGAILGDTLTRIEPSLRALGWSFTFFVALPWLGPAAAAIRDSERHLIPVSAALGVLGAALSWWVLQNVGASAGVLPGLVGFGLAYGTLVGLVPWAMILGFRYLGRRAPYHPGPF